MPDVLALHVRDREGQAAVVKVEVERPTIPKPFVGGFRHKGTLIEYHHASSQTPKVVDLDAKSVVKAHRDTQTVEERTRGTQSKRECGTQMRKVGVYVSDENDREITVSDRAYFSSADFHALRVEKAGVIQCHARGMLARSRARRAREMKEDKAEAAARDFERKSLEEELRHKREIQRRMHPRTVEDFQTLYKELELWRVKEVE